jgi:predicted metal-binding membrane protein
MRRPEALTAVLLFAGSTAVTLAWCGSMSAMPGMEMPGGWSMSMAWMRMPGQSWWSAATVFMGMWTVMMVAMMLPALTPALLRYRQATGLRDGGRLRALTALTAFAYFGVWILSALAIFPLGIGLAELEMRLPSLARFVPLAAAIAVMLAGVLQLSAWKSRQLACCRPTMRPSFARPTAARTAWRHGWRLGLRCFKCCAPLTALLLVLGVMELRAMALVTAAITLERLAPQGQRAASIIGVLMVAGGAGLLLRA